MFTGIIEALGRVAELQGAHGGMRIQQSIGRPLAPNVCMCGFDVLYVLGMHAAWHAAASSSQRGQQLRYSSI